MIKHIAPFAVAFVVFAAVFLALDVALMDAQGLSLIFRQ